VDVAGAQLMPDLSLLRWAVADSDGGMTAIMAIYGDGAQPAKSMVAVVCSWELAEHIVTAHNANIGEV
jgi:hypothetical protein